MATIIKRGKKWQARIRLKGVSLSQIFITKAQASSWATQTEAQIINGEYDTGTDKTLGDAIDRYFDEVSSRKKSHKSESFHLLMIRRHEIAEIRLSKLTTERLAQYRDELLGRVKESSARKYLALIAAVLKVAQKEWQWIKENPIADMKRPSSGKPRDRIFTDEEVERFCDLMAGRPFATDTQRTVVDCFLFALETGMRAGEIIGLEWADIDGRVATLHDTKNGDKRRVPLSSKALAVLDSRRDFKRPFNIKGHSLSACLACTFAMLG